MAISYSFDVNSLTLNQDHTNRFDEPINEPVLILDHQNQNSVFEF